MSVISLRLKDRELKRLAELSKLTQKDKSMVARELMEYGWEFMMIRTYKEGKLSLSTLASRLDMSVSETIDLLSEFNIQSPIEYADYLKGFEGFK
jgi:diphthamide synthase (EF-2-diphthine--ammonia ligase)